MSERIAVTDRAKLRPLLDAIANQVPNLGLDTEYYGPNKVHLTGKNSSTNEHRATLAGLSFAVEGRSWYVPVAHQRKNLDIPSIQALLMAMEGYEGTLWAHNSKAELLSSRQGPIPWDLRRCTKARLGCTQVLAHLAQQPAPGGTYGLKALAKLHLGREMLTYDEVTKGGWFSTLDPTAERPLRYACEDAEAALELSQFLLPKLLPGQEELFWSQETWVQQVFRDIEDCGMQLDRDTLRGALRGFKARLKRLEEDWDFVVGGVSMSSSKQLQAMYAEGLWDTTGIPKNTQGYSTEKEYIEEQLVKCPVGSRGHLAAQIKVEHGGLAKLISTYGERMIEKADQYPDLRLHGGFNATGTATGRPSSSYPNLLNIPKHSEDGHAIRNAFVAREGYTLLSADYSQIELRILAHLMGHGGLYDAISTGGDPHQATADAAGVDRQGGKFINFAVMYKVGAAKLARTVGTDYEGGLKIMRRFHKAEPGIKALEEEVLEAARARGYGRTLGGRHRAYPMLKSRNKEVRGYEERRAWNNPFQAGARDIMTRAMVEVWRKMDRSKASICLQIYDDLVVECRGDYADEMHELMVSTMENAWKLRVPLSVSPARGKRWGDHK